MSRALLDNEIAVRLSFFFGIFLIMGLWEVVRPHRQLNYSKLLRWRSNLSIVAINTLLVRALFTSSALGFAALAQNNSWGLFAFLELPSWATIVLAVVLLDLAIYLQHVMFHAVPALWRLHRMHHADLDYDVTTGARFHPIEIVLSMTIKMAVIALLGAPPLAVLIFEILLNATAMFNHANVSLPGPVDRVLRWILVTPDMHRIHHSIHVNETNSNFGFNLPWWDRLLGTYLDRSQDSPQEMTIGIDLFRASRFLYLRSLLLQPFYRARDHYAIHSDQDDRAA